MIFAISDRFYRCQKRHYRGSVISGKRYHHSAGTVKVRLASDKGSPKGDKFSKKSSMLGTLHLIVASMLRIVCVYKKHLEPVMNSIVTSAAAKKRTNLSLDTNLLQEAKSLGINLSQSAETGIAEAIKQRKQALWLRNNAEAITSSNEFINQNGLPLAQYRSF